MTQKGYRRLTRFLFTFLFLVFVLLYLLLSQSHDRGSATGGGMGWKSRSLSLGDVAVSETRSGGFIVDEFPFPASTHLGAEDFSRQVLVCRTGVENQGEGAVTVSLSIHGTRLDTEDTAPEGLNCGVYHYSGVADPVGADYPAFLDRVQALPPDAQRLTLWQEPDSGRFTLEPGERRELVLFFWVDDGAVPTLTDLDRERYSVTAKLTSRAA